MKRRIALLISLCLMAGLMPVMAEGSFADDMTFTAEELYQMGLAAYVAEDYAKAAAYYELALERYREAAEKGEAAAVEQPDRPDGEGNAVNDAADDDAAGALERLYALNRASIANMSIGRAPSTSSDTAARTPIPYAAPSPTHAC